MFFKNDFVDMPVITIGGGRFANNQSRSEKCLMMKKQDNATNNRPNGARSGHAIRA
jgi:hypothetical protein